MSAANDIVRYIKIFFNPIIMEKGELKKEVKNLLKDLPEDANWDDVMYKIYVRQSIEQGLEDSKEGRIISNEEVRKKYKRAK
ncbi:MAG: hypothetical protein WD491_10825 [Balneolales bacterium]